jgi:ABC-type glycerol-3-phosphate transport system permease component
MVAKNVQKQSAHRSEARKLGSGPIWTASVYVILVLVAVVMLMPFIHEIAKSFSHPVAANSGEVVFIPKNPTIENYTYFLQDRYHRLWNSFLITIYLTTFTSLFSVTLTAMAAYPMSRPKKEFPLLGVMQGLLVFSLVFFPPLVPYFLTVRGYGLMDTLWAIILAHSILPFNLVLAINYFRGLPEEILDSCRVDGASDFLILFRIVIPLSAPMLATITVYISVLIWNIYLHPLLFIRSPEIMPLQPVVRSIFTESLDATQARNDTIFDNSESTKSALLLLSIAPIVAVYPLLQRYFVKGALLGAVKS